MKRCATVVLLLCLSLAVIPAHVADAQPSEWRQIGPLLNGTPTGVVTAPTWPRDRLLFSYGHGRIWRSIDDGATWTYLPHRTADFGGVSLTPGVDQTGIVFAFTASESYGLPTRMFRSMDYGITWTPVAEIAVSTSSGITGAGLRFPPGFPEHGTAFYLNEKHLLRTTDFGASWDWIDIRGDNVVGAAEGVAVHGQQILQLEFAPDFPQSRTVFAVVATAPRYPYPADNGEARQRQRAGLPPLPGVHHRTSLGVVAS